MTDEPSTVEIGCWLAALPAPLVPTLPSMRSLTRISK